MTNTVCLVKQCKRTIMFNNITTLFNNNVFSRSRLEKRTSNLWAGKGEKIPGHIYRNVEVTSRSKCFVTLHQVLAFGDYFLTTIV